MQAKHGCNVTGLSVAGVFRCSFQCSNVLGFAPVVMVVRALPSATRSRSIALATFLAGSSSLQSLHNHVTGSFGLLLFKPHHLSHESTGFWHGAFPRGP